MLKRITLVNFSFADLIPKCQFFVSLLILLDGRVGKHVERMVERMVANLLRIVPGLDIQYRIGFFISDETDVPFFNVRYPA